MFRSGISVSFRYFGFVSVSLGTVQSKFLFVFVALRPMSTAMVIAGHSK